MAKDARTAGTAQRVAGRHGPGGREGAPEDYDPAGVDPDIAPRLMELVSPRRFLHCKHVANLAASLARRWGLDENDARRAGLLHDIWRDRRDEWRAAAEREGIPLPDWTGGDAGHLHGPLGALQARREFGLPEAWCRGIASHTTGGPGTSREELILFIADHAAEGRRKPQIPHWRDLAHQDLEAAAIEMYDELLGSLLQQGAPLWPPTVKARNTLVLARRRATGQAPIPQRGRLASHGAGQTQS
jgi:predicted HD superfamily hydrolase involved in NAD metabolism